MTIEEKAKAYDEALERAKNFIENGDQGEKTIAESIFAGLIDGESEDERIRKSIIRLLQVGGYMPLEDKEKAFAYLEKQKEQKPKRERKKPKESWLSKLKYELAHEEELLIERGKELSEIGALKNKDQKEQKSSIVEKLREISTPADEDWFEIEKKWESEDNEDLRSFISVKFASNAKVIDGKRFAVFTWERFKDIALELINRGKEKQKEQKPSALQNAFECSVKDYSLEEKRKASDYAESILPTSIAYGENEEEYKLHKIIEAAFIAGQKERKPAEWSEEDEEMLNTIIADVSRTLNSCGIGTDEWNIRSKAIHYLKSLYPSWKPSKEQMKALKVVVSWDSKAYYMDGLESLYNDLQKLF